MTVPIGVIGLDTSFTKIPGHVRNPATFDFPVLYEVVAGASPERVVTRADPTLIEPFAAAARRLQDRGAGAITTGCGFLVLFQAELAAAVDVPLYASSLLQLPLVHRMLRPGRKVGVLTAKAPALTPRHLRAAGAADVPVAVAGMEDQPEFREVILGGHARELDPDRLRAEVLGRAGALVRAEPALGALLLECTDLVPFAAALQERTGLPVFDIVTLTGMVHATLTRRPY